VTLSAAAASATAAVNITTTGATARLARPRLRGWPQAGGGAVLAFLVFLGIPGLRRNRGSLLGLLVLLIALGGLTACGGGGGSSSGGGSGGTTAGTYVFTVTTTGSPSVIPAPTATITLTVN
jgi:hypothetical protein